MNYYFVIIYRVIRLQIYKLVSSNTMYIISITLAGLIFNSLNEQELLEGDVKKSVYVIYGHMSVSPHPDKLTL